jgi:hypothetical protein
MRIKHLPHLMALNTKLIAMRKTSLNRESNHRPLPFQANQMTTLPPFSILMPIFGWFANT